MRINQATPTTPPYNLANPCFFGFDYWGSHYIGLFHIHMQWQSGIDSHMHVHDHWRVVYKVWSKCKYLGSDHVWCKCGRDIENRLLKHFFESIFSIFLRKNRPTPTPDRRSDRPLFFGFDYWVSHYIGLFHIHMQRKTGIDSHMHVHDHWRVIYKVWSKFKYLHFDQTLNTTRPCTRQCMVESNPDCHCIWI